MPFLISKMQHYMHYEGLLVKMYTYKDAFIILQDLGLNCIYNEDEEFKLICGMIDALAFLPPDDVQEGMQLLRRIAPIVVEDLLNYFDSVYISGTLRIVQRNGNNIVRHTPPLFPKELWNVCQATVNDEPLTDNQC